MIIIVSSITFPSHYPSFEIFPNGSWLEESSLLSKQLGCRHIKPDFYVQYDSMLLRYPTMTQRKAGSVDKGMVWRARESLVSCPQWSIQVLVGDLLICIIQKPSLCFIPHFYSSYSQSFALLFELGTWLQKHQMTKVTSNSFALSVRTCGKAGLATWPVLLGRVKTRNFDWGKVSGTEREVCFGVKRNFMWLLTMGHSLSSGSPRPWPLSMAEDKWETNWGL